MLGMNEAVLPVAINGVPRNQPLDRSLGFLPQRIEQMRLVFSEYPWASILLYDLYLHLIPTNLLLVLLPTMFSQYGK